MGIKQKSKYCKMCQMDVVAQATSPNHLLHLVLTILTGSVWALVWVVLWVMSWGGYRCQQCGRKI